MIVNFLSFDINKCEIPPVFEPIFKKLLKFNFIFSINFKCRIALSSIIVFLKCSLFFCNQTYKNSLSQIVLWIYEKQVLLFFNFLSFINNLNSSDLINLFLTMPKKFLNFFHLYDYNLQNLF